MKKLTKEQFHVLKEKGTEMPGTGKLLHNKKSGNYFCANCGNQIFSSENKFDSDVDGLRGWPSFSEAISDSVELKKDYSHNLDRIEIVCKNCNGHLGHLFDDYKSKTGKHFCVNSCVLDFKEKYKKPLNCKET